MKREKLLREIKKEALARMEGAARTDGDFSRMVSMWDKLDENRERRERFHEIGRNEKLIEYGYGGGTIIPPPLLHPYWREIMRGDFLSAIFDNADEMWRIIGDWEAASLLKRMPAKRREVLFLRAMRLCPTAQIACCFGKTDRAIRKLLAAALEYIRSRLAERIRERIVAEAPVSKRKRDFLEWYDVLDGQNP